MSLKCGNSKFDMKLKHLKRNIKETSWHKIENDTKTKEMMEINLDQELRKICNILKKISKKSGN